MFERNTIQANTFTIPLFTTTLCWILASVFSEPSFANTGKIVKPSHLNSESELFYRLTLQGKPFNDQTRPYDQAPWSCVDDLRYRQAPYRKAGFGIHVWYFPLNSHSLPVESTIRQLNRDKTCGVTHWGLPTVAEWEFLLTKETPPEAKRLAFPLSFPFLTHRYYWANANAQRHPLKPKIYDVRTGQFVVDTSAINPDQVAILYKSWTKIAEPIQPLPNDFTREQSRAEISHAKRLYAKADPKTWPLPWVDEGIEWQPLGQLPTLHQPSDSDKQSLSPIKDWKALTALGKQFFFEPRLSQARDVSCASCHMPTQGWDDNLRVAIGDNNQKGSRNSPSLLNIAHQTHFFWDGRATTLQEQALQPIINPIEMNLPLADLEKRIHRGEFDDYHRLTQTVFGDTTLTPQRIGLAIAEFEKTIIANNTPFDRWLRGEGRLNDQAIWGLHLFRTKARCMNCHFGPNFTNNQFEDIGLSDYEMASQRDLGRYEVTKQPEDIGRFKVSSLREIMHTAPYMHNGRFHLQEVLTSYNVAMGLQLPTKLKLGARRHDPLFPKGTEKLHILNLRPSELKALEQFLKSLSSKPEDLPQL